MPLSKVHKTILGGDPLQPLDGAVCTINIATTSDLQPIFSDRDGVILAANPITTSTDGLLSFYIEPGLYDLRVDHPSGEQIYEDYLAVDDRVNSLVFTPQTGGGYVWAFMPPQGLNSGQTSTAFYSVASDDSGVWVAISGNGYAARTTDDGVTWAQLPQDLNVPTAVAWRSVRHGDSDVWVAVGNDGHASRSTDNGATWAELTPAGLNSGNATAFFQSIATDGAGVWIAAANSGFASRSTDNGATWSAVTIDMGAAAIDINSIDTNGTGNWVAVGEGGYASISTDNGATWTPLVRGLNSGLVDNDFNAVKFGLGGSVVAAGAHQDNCAISSDNGATWAQIPGGIPMGGSGSIFTLATNSAGVWNAGGSSGYTSLSSSNGQTWSPHVRGLNADVSDQLVNEIYAGANGTWMGVMLFGQASVSRTA